MASVETSPKNNVEGVYKHPETGVEVEIRRHPKFGTAQADGFVAVGFVFDRPLDEAAKEETKPKGGAK